MPAWAIPLLVQLGEALAVGASATLATYQLPGSTFKTAVVAGFAALLGKLMPTQVFGATPPTR